MRTSYFYYFISSPISVNDFFFILPKTHLDSKDFIYELKGKSIIFISYGQKFFIYSFFFVRHTTRQMSVR